VVRRHLGRNLVRRVLLHVEDEATDLAVTVVFLAVADAGFAPMTPTDSKTLLPTTGRIRLDLTIDRAVAQARDIESKRQGRRGYLLTANVRSRWLRSHPQNVAGGGEIVQVEVLAQEPEVNTVDQWRCVAQYAEGIPLVVEVNSFT
jgi:hypothetical protein